jgi:hypothetical protein
MLQLPTNAPKRLLLPDVVAITMTVAVTAMTAAAAPMMRLRRRCVRRPVMGCSVL